VNVIAVGVLVQFAVTSGLVHVIVAAPAVPLTAIVPVQAVFDTVIALKVNVPENADVVTVTVTVPLNALVA